MVTYFLDTDTCVYFLRAESSKLRNKLFSLVKQIKVPAIVKAELYSGVVKSGKFERFDQLKRFLEMFEIVPFCNKCCATYAYIRHDLEKRGKKISPNDLIIASTSLAHEGVLITHNIKKFSRVKQLQCEDWI